MNIEQIQNASLRLRNNKIFELFVVSIIILSALLIGAKTYQIPDGVMQLVKWLDLAITIIFLIEITIRFIAEENKKRFFHNGWNVFDTLIVIVSLIPIDDSEMALIGRLVRIFRVLRMISIIPELRMLLNSLLRAMPQLGYVLLLMFIIFYIYAAVGATFFAKINPELWGDISISLLTLFRVMTFED
jgi:voltage-gated sodium channel